jgi:hypothetical protein
MWNGLTSGLSGALQSLDQAARDLTTIELEDDDDEYGEEPRALPRGAPRRQRRGSGPACIAPRADAGAHA